MRSPNYLVSLVIGTAMTLRSAPFVTSMQFILPPISALV